MIIKRPLLILTGGFVLGEAVILQRSVVMELMGAAVLVSVLWFAFCFFKGRSIWLWLLPVFLFAGLGRGMIVREARNRELALGLEGQRVTVVGTVCETKEKEGRFSFILNDCEVLSSRAAPEGSHRLERILVYAKDEIPLRLGNRVRVWGDCVLPSEARNPGESDSRLYYRSMRISYQMLARYCEVQDDSLNVYGEALCSVRKWAGQRLEQITGTDAGLFQAIILGDKTELSDDIRDMYRKNGIAHLLAVSGLHLSMVGASIYGAVRKLGGGYAVAGLFGGVVLISYAVLTGSSPSVLRAMVMMLCGFFASYLGRTYDLLSALSMSALFLFWDSPYLICQPGAQLSFAAVLGIGLAQETGTWHRGSEQAFFVSIGMQLMLLPILLYHFFWYPLYGIFLNLLVVPLLGIVIGTGIFGVLISAFYLPAGRFLTGGGRVVLDWYDWCCRWFQLLPGSDILFGRPEPWQILVYYGLFALAICIMRKRKRMGAAVFVLAVFLLLPIPVRGLHVTFLDVGQGDGICLQTAEGVILMDCGSKDQKKLGAYSLAPFLASHGIRQVDYAVVSHGDEDHISGLRCLLEGKEKITVNHLVLPAAGGKDEAYLTLERLAKEHGCMVHWMGRGDRIQMGKLELACLFPERDNGEDLSVLSERNEHSLVFQVTYGDFHMLLTGDMSGKGEARLLRLMNEEGICFKDVSVLKVAHHGSRSSTTQEWLEAVRPVWAVLSYGRRNPYGHPHKEVMGALGQYGVTVFETAKSGAVYLRTDGRRIWWKKWLEE